MSPMAPAAMAPSLLSLYSAVFILLAPAHTTTGSRATASARNTNTGGSAPQRQPPVLLECMSDQNAAYYERALRQMRESVRLAEAAGEAESSAALRSHMTIGQCIEEQATAFGGGWIGNPLHGEAVAAYAKAYTGLLKLQGEEREDHRELLQVCTVNYGINYERVNDLKRAQALYSEALAAEPLHRTARSHLRDMLDWQNPTDPSLWHRVADEGVKLGVWVRSAAEPSLSARAVPPPCLTTARTVVQAHRNQTPAMEFYHGMDTVAWPDVPTKKAVAAGEAAEADVRRSRWPQVVRLGDKLEGGWERIRDEALALGKGKTQNGVMEGTAAGNGNGPGGAGMGAPGGWCACPPPILLGRACPRIYLSRIACSCLPRWPC
eukprot:SAG22_NODE_264_length_13353_cov_34.575298_7_plen_378_part_00